MTLLLAELGFDPATVGRMIYSVFGLGLATKNGMNKCIIQPITSEPIIVITKDRLPKILIPAGTQIPSNIQTIDDLVTSRDNQEIIELPICVGNANKLLFNLKIVYYG